jgi:hypothetical protein
MRGVLVLLCAVFFAAAEQGFSKGLDAQGRLTLSGPACVDGSCKLDVQGLLASGILTPEEITSFLGDGGRRKNVGFWAARAKQHIIVQRGLQNTYTTTATFEQHISNPIIDHFDTFSVTTSTPSPIVRTPPLYTVTLSAAQGFYFSGTTSNPAVALNESLDPINFAFSSTVFSFGCNFYASDISGSRHRFESG